MSVDSNRGLREDEMKPVIKTSAMYWIWMLCLAELPVIGVIVFYWKKSRLLERGLSPELYSALLSWTWISTAYSILRWVMLALKIVTGVSTFLGVVAEIVTHWG